MISKTSEYALRAVLHLAQGPSGIPRRAADLADSLQVPPNYLAKILHALARSGVLTSERGRHGGFQLALPPSELSLAQVIETFDPLSGRRECLLGRGECSDGDPCAAHDRWKQVHDRVTRFFRETTVAELVRSPATRGAILSEKGAGHA